MKNLITLALTVAAITSLTTNAYDSRAYSNENQEMRRTRTDEDNDRGLVRNTGRATGNVVEGTGRAAGNVVEGTGKAAGTVVEGTGNVIKTMFGGGKRKEDKRRDADDRTKRNKDRRSNNNIDENEVHPSDMKELGGLNEK